MYRMNTYYAILILNNPVNSFEAATNAIKFFKWTSWYFYIFFTKEQQKNIHFYYKLIYENYELNLRLRKIDKKFKLR